MSKIQFNVERSSDPDYPGLYIYALRTNNKEEDEEVGCILMEFNENTLSIKAWEHKDFDGDPVSDVVLFKEEESFKCPICKGHIMIRRIDDGDTLCRVEDNGSLTELSLRSDGNYTIFCEVDLSHIIPQEIQDELLLIYEENY